jgi:hypothetical protein
VTRAKHTESKLTDLEQKWIEELPTLDDYFCSAIDLAKIVRRAFDQGPGSVKRSELLAALERFERHDRASRNFKEGAR